MRARTQEQRARQREALRALGVSADVPRVVEMQGAATGHEAELLSLPHAEGSGGSQVEPTTGKSKFVVGYSQVGGGDVVSGPD